MSPSRPLPAWIAFAFLSLLALLARGSRAFAEDAPGKAEPGKEGAPAGEPGLGDEGDDIDDSEDGPAEFRAAVDSAIDKGVMWLKKKQGGDGSWGAIEGNRSYAGGEKSSGNKQQHSGPTSLALYTLLKCKVPENDPVVRKGFAWLKKHHKLPKDAYETSTLLLAVTATADPFKKRSASEAAAEKDKVRLTGEFRGWAVELQKHLLKKRAALGWRYGSGGGSLPGGDQDMSSTQMACLALFAADRCGIKTDGKIWNDMITFSLKMQEKDGPSVERAVEGTASEAAKGGVAKSGMVRAEGDPAPPEKPRDRARGHAYILSDDLDPDEGQATGGMTACGLGTIMMARFILMHRNDRGWESRDKAVVQQSVYDSVAWLSHNFEPITNPKKRSLNIYHLYYLYCVERAFDMIGNRRLGKRFWYVEMGQRLLQIQKPQGFWKTGSTHDPEDTLDTCFALLFLKRATRGGIPFPNITGGSETPPVDNRGK
jgi:hypothetical protein